MEVSDNITNKRLFDLAYQFLSTSPPPEKINRSYFCQILNNSDKKKYTSTGGCPNPVPGKVIDLTVTIPGIGCRKNNLDTENAALFTSISTESGIATGKPQPYSAVGCGQQDSNGKNLFSNQAFVLVSSGEVDANGDGDLFDGENVRIGSHYSGANQNLGFLNCFESPARGRSADYDDIVLAVSFNELRTRLCH